MPQNIGQGGKSPQLVDEQQLPQAKNIKEHQEVFKKPYSFDYFNINKDLEKIQTYQEWGKAIDDFIQFEITANALEDTLDTYKHIIKDIIKSMNINPDLVGHITIEKLYRWINEVLRPQREVEQRRKEIIG